MLVQGTNFYNSIKKTLDSFFDETKVTDVHSQIGQNFNFMYQNMLLFLKDFAYTLQSLKSSIIEPLDNYKKIINNSYSSVLKQFNDLIKRHKTAKDVLTKAQTKYYNLYNSLSKMEKEKRTDDQYLKLKSQVDINCQIYKYEILNANRQYIVFDREYFNIYKKLKEIEESRLSFSKGQIDNLIFSYEKFGDIFKELTTTVKSKVSQWKIESDLKLFDEEFNFVKSNTKTRFNKEIFENFSNNFDYNNQNNSKGENLSIFSRGKKIISFLGEYEIIDKEENENFQNNIIAKILFFLESEEEIPVDIITMAARLIANDKNFSIALIKGYIDKHKTNFFKIPNYKNIFHFSNILNAIILNCDLDKENMNNLLIAIIVIAQKCYTHNNPVQDNSNEKYFSKLFLCGVISKNLVFKSHSFWYEVIECKFKTKMIPHIKAIVERDKEFKIKKANDEKMKKSLDLQQNKGHTRSYTSGVLQNSAMTTTSSMLGSIGSGFKSFFAKDKPASNSVVMEKQKKKVNNEFVNVTKFTQYENLDKQYQLEFNKKSYEELHLVIKEFIPYFINFSFGLTNAIDFLVEISNKYNVSNELINYYVICLNSASYSSRQFPPLTPVDTTLRANIENFKYNRNDAIFAKYPLYKGINSIKDCEKNVIIGNVVPFLDTKDKVSILLLSKKNEKFLKKAVYKHLLNKEGKNKISLETRLKIWESALKTHAIKKKISYQENLKEVLKIEYDRFSNTSFAIIDLDVQRTMFEDNVEESRAAINRILKTITHLNQEMNYFQGMNFIASFLYHLTKSEERTFYLMLGLIKTTKFSKIFYDDLKRLKQYFNIFDKILFLYLPVLNIYFKNNNILTNYYLSAWFITLFTNTIGKGSSLNAIITIWDNFIISGWKSIFSAALSLLELQEEKMISLKTEPLLLFLSGEIVQKDLFEDDANFIKTIKANKIKNQLLHNLKNEIRHEKELTTEKKDSS